MLKNSLLLAMVLALGTAGGWLLLSGQEDREGEIKQPISPEFVQVSEKDRTLTSAGYQIILPEEFLSASSEGWVASGWQDTDVRSYAFKYDDFSGAIWTTGSTYAENRETEDGSLEIVPMTREIFPALWKSDVPPSESCQLLREKGCRTTVRVEVCSRHLRCQDFLRIQLFIWKLNSEWATDLYADLNHQPTGTNINLDAFEQVLVSAVR